MDNQLYLKVPKLEDLWYRKQILADPDTMEYNKGYDTFEGYNRETGCIDFKEEKWKEWYDRSVNKQDRFYAYICRKEDDKFIGDVGFRYDNEYKEWITHIVIDAKYRGMGYSEEALRLLINVAFDEYNLDSLADNIPANRIGSIKLFEKVGFKDLGKDLYVNKFDEKEKVKLMKLKKEEYLKKY